MPATTLVGPEAVAFRDVPADKLAQLESTSGFGIAPIDLENIDIMLQAAEEPLPVMSVAVGHVKDFPLPHIWIGLGKTKPGQGLRYAEDTKYIPRRDAPSERIQIPGLAVPVEHDSASSVKFWPYKLQEDRDEAPVTWWEQWKRHSFTQQDGDTKRVREYEEEVSFPLIATWFDQDSTTGSPIIVAHDPDASETQLIPEDTPFARHQRAIFVGEYAVQGMLNDTSRMAVPRELATEQFHAMMNAAAGELNLEYRP